MAGQTPSYGVGIKVCLDENADLRCGSTELAAVTNAAGEYALTVPGSELSRLGANWLLAELPYATGMSIMLSKPYEQGSIRYVISPLTTHVEQLVLATVARPEAVQVVRSLAGLQSLAVDADFVAAATGAAAAEAASAAAAAAACELHQTLALVDLLRAPAGDYWQARSSQGTYRVTVASSGTGGSLQRLVSTTTTTQGDYSVYGVSWTYGPPITGLIGWSAPIESATEGQVFPGPMLEVDGQWSDGTAPTEMLRTSGGRVHYYRGGKLRTITARSVEVLDGQEITSKHYGGRYVLPVQRQFLPGSQSYSQQLVVAVSSHGDTTELVERRDRNGALFTFAPSFATVEALRAHYLDTDGNWYRMNLAGDVAIDGFQMAFTATSGVRFREVDNSFTEGDPRYVLREFAPTTIASYVFGGQTIVRVPLPPELRGAIGPVLGLSPNELDYVASPQGVRRIYVNHRSGIQSLPSRMGNLTAARSVLQALGWPEPSDRFVSAPPKAGAAVSGKKLVRNPR